MFCFPPIAALIPAAARLMLALLERAVTDAGGAYAFCDTDSMAIVATEMGGTISCEGGAEQTDNGQAAVRALSWGEVRTIVDRFAKLNPYDRARVPGSVLKIEDDNFGADKAQRPLWCYMISAKRYVLYTPAPDGAPTIVKASEHGLGHLLNPTNADDESRDWIAGVWRVLLGNGPLPHGHLDRPSPACPFPAPRCSRHLRLRTTASRTRSA